MLDACDPTRVRRRRRTHVPTMPISIRLEVETYDAFCRASIVTGRSTRALMRQVLKEFWKKKRARGRRR